MTVSAPRKRQRTVPRCIYLWAVTGEPMDYVEPVPGCYGQGPTYQECAYVEVEAWTSKEARWKAADTVEFDDYVDRMRGDGRIPTSGMRVVRLHAVLPR